MPSQTRSSSSLPAVLLGLVILALALGTLFGQLSRAMAENRATFDWQAVRELLHNLETRSYAELAAEPRDAGSTYTVEPAPGGWTIHLPSGATIPVSTE